MRIPLDSDGLSRESRQNLTAPTAKPQMANQRPIVNVVALFVILLSAVPVYLAQRLAGAGAARTR